MEEISPFDIDAQTESRARAQLKAKLEAESEEADFIWLMSRKRGRRLVWRLLERAGVFRSSFSPDPTLMAFNEGARNYGLQVLAILQGACLDNYSQMVKENTNARAERTD